MRTRQKYLLPACCGLFFATSALLDWFLNTNLYNSPLSVKELWHYELFGIQPRRVLPPPDPVEDWWLVFLVFLTMFLVGFMLGKLVTEVYVVLRKVTGNTYLKAVAMAALFFGTCNGLVFAYGAFMVPAFSMGFSFSGSAPG